MEESVENDMITIDDTDLVMSYESAAPITSASVVLEDVDHEGVVDECREPGLSPFSLSYLTLLLQSRI